MLNFDEDRFLRIQAGAVAQADGIHETIGQLLARARPTSSSWARGSRHPHATRRAAAADRSTFPVHLGCPPSWSRRGRYTSAPGSIVVIPSLSGTTAESVKAMAYCQARGATVLTLTGHAGTPLAEGADHSFVNFAEDDTSCESFYLQSLLVALSVMHHRGETTSTPRP